MADKDFDPIHIFGPQMRHFGPGQSERILRSERLRTAQW